MRVKTFVLVFILFRLGTSNSLAQNRSPDSLLYSSTANQVIDYFNRTIADQSEIYNGPGYELYPSANKGSFYFKDKNYTTLSLIRYNGTWYKNVPVLYDTYHDVMVAALRDSLFILNSDKLSDVYLLSHHFIYLNAENRDNLTPGFYDLLYDGRSQVLVKRIKIIDDHIVTAQTAEIVYEDKSEVYLKKGNRYYLVDSKRSFKDIFADKKKEINQYLKDNKIDYKNDKEGAAAKLAGYYDLISK
jgi:hypothetical protein